MTGAGDGNRIVSPIQKSCVLMALPPPSVSNGAKWSQIRYFGLGAPKLRRVAALLIVLCLQVNPNIRIKCEMRINLG